MMTRDYICRSRDGRQRGRRLVLTDGVASYFPEFQAVGLKMIAAQGGIFGWTAPSANLLDVFQPVVLSA